MRVSEMAENLIGSEIIKLAGEINQKIRNGETIYNFTIGDFDPRIFPIPEELNQAIKDAYDKGQTNYPAANGMEELRDAVAGFIKEKQGLDYSPGEFLISGGARPLIYATYQALLDPGDKVIFPTPSWNNNHYTHLALSTSINLETTSDTNFMPVSMQIEPHLEEATLLSLCSPLNPTGTVFQIEELTNLCKMVVEENKKRQKRGKKPLYILYDQIYWMLTFAGIRHHDPVTLVPEIREHCIYVDGLSKTFAATGVRVGWAFGPKDIIGKMTSIISHIGAWAPKPEQIAVAHFLRQPRAIDNYLSHFKSGIYHRLKGFYDGFMDLKKKGYRVNAIEPQGGIYLTVEFDLTGKVTAEGKTLENMKDVSAYILEEAKVALVPFYAFGSSEESTWFRLSVGTCKKEDIAIVIPALEKALEKLENTTR